jgi:hypothetical protein
MQVGLVVRLARNAVFVAATLPLLGGVTTAFASLPLAATNDSFCEVAQYLISSTTQKPTTVVHKDYEAFKKSKTSVTPLEIHQFVTYADAAGTQPMRISCKLKTVDHLVSQFGATGAGPQQNTCRDLNHIMVRNVYATLVLEGQADVKFPLERIRLEPDDNHFMGSAWVSDYQSVWGTPDGGMHLLAKTLHVPYTHWLWQFAPEKFRGVYYCHLVAPEYLRALMLGQVAVPDRIPR